MLTIVPSLFFGWLIATPLIKASPTRIKSYNAALWLCRLSGVIGLIELLLGDRVLANSTSVWIILSGFLAGLCSGPFLWRLVLRKKIRKDNLV